MEDQAAEREKLAVINVTAALEGLDRDAAILVLRAVAIHRGVDLQAVGRPRNRNEDSHGT